MSFKKSGIPLKLGGEDLVGIDIGADNLRIAHAAVNIYGRIKVSNLISRSIAQLSDEEISAAIREIFSEINVKNPTVISVIPSHLVITKNIGVPSIDPDEIDSIVDLQAPRHTPYSREDIIVSYIRVGVYEGSHTRVLLVVGGRDKVRRQSDILERAGLKIEKVLFGPEVIARAFWGISKLEPQESPQAIVHIDEVSSDFITTVKGVPTFVRNIPMGTRQLAGGQEDNNAKFVEEIKKSLEVHHAGGMEESPGSFVLTGATEDIKDLRTALENALHKPAEIVSYSERLPISYNASESILANKKLSFLNNVAAILIHQKAECDLTLEETRSRRLFEERTKDIIKTGIFVVAIFFLTIGILFNKIYFRKAYLERIILKYQPIVQESKALERNFKRITMVRNFLSREDYSLEILMELYNFLPAELHFTDIRYDSSGTLSVRGVAKSIPIVFAFAYSLRESEHFQNAETRRTTKRELTGGQEVVDFEIICTFETGSE